MRGLDSVTVQQVRTVVLIAALAFSSVGAKHATGADLMSLEFRDQPVRDIVLALGDVFDESVVPDETVSGTISIRLSGGSFVDAIARVAESAGMFVTIRDGVHRVSRVHVESVGAAITVRANAAPLSTVAEMIAREASFAVVGASLPASPITIHMSSVPAQRAIEILVASSPGLAVSDFGDHMRVTEQPRATRSGAVIVESDATGVTVTSERVTAYELFTEVFRRTGHPFVIASTTNQSIGPLVFHERTPRTVVDKLARHVGLVVHEHDGTLIVSDRSVTNIPTFAFETFLPVHVSPAELLEVLAAAGHRNAVLHPAGGALVLFGTETLRELVGGFLRDIDVQVGLHEFYSYKSVWIDGSALCAAVPSRDLRTRLNVTADGKTVFGWVSRLEGSMLTTLFTRLDVAPDTHVVRLTNIDADRFFELLPRHLDRREFSRTAQSTMLVFTGSAEKYSAVEKFVSIVDTVTHQIRYHVLILQFHGGDSTTFLTDGEAGPASYALSTVPAIVGALGPLLALEMDVVSLLGIRFAARLSAELARSTARIVADTQVLARDGETVELTNTQTYRYRDLRLDPDTGAASSTGVTREIVSGIQLRIRGAVTGAGEILLDIHASVAKRGADAAAGRTNPPTTAENVVNTRVILAPGEPVRIAGLVHDDSTEQHHGVPLLARIPVIGKLFGTHRSSFERVETAMYVVPVLERSGASRDTSDDLASLLRRVMPEVSP